MVINLFTVTDVDKEELRKIIRLCQAKRIKLKNNTYVPVLKTIKETRVYHLSV